MAVPHTLTYWRYDWPFYIEYCHHHHPGDPQGSQGWHWGENNGFRWIAHGHHTLIWRDAMPDGET